MDSYQDWRVCDVCGDHTYCRKAVSKDHETYGDKELDDLCERCGSAVYKKYSYKQEVHMLYTALYELHNALMGSHLFAIDELIRAEKVLKEIGELK